MDQQIFNRDQIWENEWMHYSVPKRNLFRRSLYTEMPFQLSFDGMDVFNKLLTFTLNDQLKKGPVDYLLIHPNSYCDEHFYE